MHDGRPFTPFSESTVGGRGGGFLVVLSRMATRSGAGVRRAPSCDRFPPAMPPAIFMAYWIGQLNEYAMPSDSKMPIIAVHCQHDQVLSRSRDLGTGAVAELEPKGG